MFKIASRLRRPVSLRDASTTASRQFRFAGRKSRERTRVRFAHERRKGAKVFFALLTSDLRQERGCEASEPRTKPLALERSPALSKDGSMIWDGERWTALLRENQSGMGEDPPVAFGGQYRFAMPVRLRGASSASRAVRAVVGCALRVVGKNR